LIVRRLALSPALGLLLVVCLCGPGMAHAQRSTSTLLNIQREQDESRRQRMMSEMRQSSETFARRWQSGSTSGAGRSGGAAVGAPMSGSGRKGYTGTGYLGGPAVDSGPASIESTTTVNTLRAPMNEREIAGLVKLAADAGDAQAQMYYGQMLFLGYGPLQPDRVAAQAWLSKAAQAGQPGAMGLLAWMHKYGVGTAADPQEALRWMRTGADKGDPYATFLLASAHLVGEGVPRNLPEGLTWARRAAERGDAHAQWFVGQTYYEGGILPKDLSQAALWLQRASAQNEVNAASTLGVMHLTGEIPGAQAAEGVKLLQRAADAGDAKAMNNLGLALLQGLGLPADAAAGARWVRQSAEKGYAYGQFTYAQLLRGGREYLPMPLRRCSGCSARPTPAAKRPANNCGRWAASHPEAVGDKQRPGSAFRLVYVAQGSKAGT